MFGKRKERVEKYQNSPTNTPMLNYRAYVMGKAEAVLVYVAIFCLGGLVGLVFYEGLFKVDGYPTVATFVSDAFFFIVVGLVAVKVFVPVYVGNRLEKQQGAIGSQFRDMLDALASSFSTGSNVPMAFASALEDLKRQYAPSDHIVKEMDEIVNAMGQGVGVDAMLRDFADRSGNEDIASFADIFQVCYRKGGDMSAIVHQTHSVIGEKMAVMDEVQTKLTSNKMQHNVMSVMPIAIVVLLRISNESFAENFATPTGVMASTVAIAVFVGAYLYGKKIVDVRA